MSRMPQTRIGGRGLVLLTGFLLMAALLWAEAQPGGLAARLAMGNADYRHSDYGDAEVQFRRALGNLGEDGGGPAYYNLGNALYQQGRYREAIEQYGRALSGVGAPVSARARTWANLGNAHYQTGDAPRSLAAFQRALVLAPGDEAIRQDFLFVLAAAQPKRPQQSAPHSKKQAAAPDEKKGPDKPPGEDKPNQDPGSQQGASEQQLSAKKMEELLGLLSENENKVRNHTSGPGQQGRKTASDEKDY